MRGRVRRWLALSGTALLLLVGGWGELRASSSPGSSPGSAVSDLRERLAASLVTVRQEAVSDTDTVVLPYTTRVDPATLEEVPSDTLEAAGDTLAAPGDTAREADVEAMREELAGGAFPERDSLFRSLQERQGFRAIEYRGRRVELRAERREIVLRDSAQTNYGDAALRADSITYVADAEFVTALGAIHLLSPDQREMSSDSVLYYDVSTLKGTVLDARTNFAQRGAEWQVRGDAVPVGSETVYVTHGQFSSCQLEEPHYHFRAGQIKMVSQNVIVAWPVVLHIKRVPVFWLPFFAQDIRPERRSGLIPPQFGFNDVVRTSSGFNRQVSDFGYYWAINRFMDAQVTMDWFSDSHTRLNGAFRYNVRKKFMRGNVQVSQEWGETGNNLRLRLNHDQELSPATQIRASANYVQSTRRLQDRSFDPRDQTQSIDSEAGISHRFPFATLNVNARRVQRASEDERVDWTLPGASLSFSPVTLFSAPRNRAGPFNNMTLSGGVRYSRREQIRELSDDRTSQDASVNQSLRIGEFSLSSSASFRDQVTTPPVDSLGQQMDPFSQSTVDWNTSGDYKVDLMGSTTLRPTVRVRGALFRSSVPGDSVMDTDGAYLAAPTRASFGASLRTDVYGFFPGIGPFSQIRHKFSPSFDWSYSPRTTADEELLEIPDFPGRPGRAEHTLRINLSQTFEAKIPARDASEGEEDEAPPDSVPEGIDADAAVAAADSAAALDAGDAEVADTAAAAVPSDTAEAAEGETTGGRATTGAGAQAGQQERKVTLLSIRSDALAFDFERAAEGEPVLTTDRFGNSVSSDLLRGLSLNVEHDLFRGSGTEREFDPFLSRLTASFSFASGTSLGDLIGLGGGGGPSRPSPRDPVRDLSQADRLSEFDPSQDAFDEDTEAGPWNLSLNYSLRRSRPEQGTEPNQTLSGNLSLRPTPNWRIRWNTQYNITTREFGQHVVNLERDLHRWRASFTFSKSPNGNFIFSFRVFLTDAPELKVDYDQRSSPTVGG